MLAFTVKRLFGVIPVLLVVSLMIFALMQAAPGDPVSMLVSDEASAEDRERIAAAWGLDQPAPVQYANFVKNAATGDFGTSFRYREPVMDLVLARLPASIELALYATLLAIAVGIPLGVLAAARPNSVFDTIGSIGGFFGISMPNFWLGILMILIFAGYLNILPSGGREPWGLDLPRITGFLTLDAVLQGRWDALVHALRYLALPTIVLGTAMTGIIMQITRASMLENLGEDYVMTARAKGLSNRVVLWRHAFRNALVSVITIIGLEFGALISGAIIVETVFSWPGIGLLLIQGITFRDFPLITGLVLIYTTLFVLLNVFIDILYTIVDPRIRMR
ncbi:ABC transporter permease [Roseinatronobacter bogoriensis]|uniref:ABC transporter permease n=1 Tax=Roseinatronobacter bogoriensis subsp. barguzinensis TaxID=441209 RepID=A0A2K8K9Y3_9RHOB|nr:MULTISPECIES: ABC transporter permease [Rhodobaca]ATX64515.1 ABC transporter permease [Rhodobaca barguzinensis]MBB4209230.1 peptide/nickel transport system permease protein [Rhodobaca bogoriensis DSM 18756]TDW36244.1 peptide/nickel transport system permease protein [Rhodobaca barguzinensis]TDY67628.1 peptide/nickel transport system permease protein [Rhodobaca bogoriensis DSM 18756]